MKVLGCFASLLISSALFAQAPEDAPEAAPQAKPESAAETPPAPEGEAKPAAAPKADPADKTKAAKKGEKIALPQAAKTSKPLPLCTTYSATPFDSSLLSFEKKIYFTSPKLPSDSGAATHYLIEVDIPEAKAKRVVGFKSGTFVSLIAHDPEPRSISILDFSKGKPDCGEGLTSGTLIKLSEKKVSPSFPSANYGLIPGDSSAHLGDLDKGIIQDLDIKTGQRRMLESFNKGTRPVYLKVAPPIALYVYNPETRELAKYIANKKTAESKLKLKEGMRLVRDGEKFGVVSQKGLKLQVAEIKGWSGDAMKTADLDLTPEFSTQNPSVKALFASDEYLVIGKDDTAQKMLKTVLYFKGKDRKIFKAPDAKSYFSHVEFTGDGTVALLLSEESSNVVRELWLSKDGAEPQKIDVLKVKKPGAKPKAK